MTEYGGKYVLRKFYMNFVIDIEILSILTDFVCGFSPLKSTFLGSTGIFISIKFYIYTILIFNQSLFYSTMQKKIHKYNKW